MLQSKYRDCVLEWRRLVRSRQTADEELLYLPTVLVLFINLLTNVLQIRVALVLSVMTVVPC